ncbi:hypothetical protein GCM10027521_14370 [Amycolatopsis cihanbeyliensis]
MLGELLAVPGGDCHLPGVRSPVVYLTREWKGVGVVNVVPYGVWLLLVACLVVAMPWAGIAAVVVSALGLSWLGRRRSGAVGGWSW